MNAAGGRHGLGMSDQIENRVIDAKSRGIYEAPGMALCEHRLRAAPQRGPQREHDGPLLLRSVADWGGCSTRGGGSIPESLMLKEALTRWVAPAVTGTVTLELRRGDDYTILDTKAARSAYEPAQALDGEDRERLHAPRTASARSRCSRSESSTTASSSCTSRRRSERAQARSATCS